MVFITVGNQNFSFSRLILVVEHAIQKGVIKDKVIAQVGHTKVKSDLIECKSFFTQEEFDAKISQADYIIAHAGTGSIISCLKKRKKVIVGARLEKYDEHIDNHQVEILEAFSAQNLIIPLDKELENFEEIIKHIEDYDLAEFKSNNEKFNVELTRLIDNL